jgi:signal transduction histidine kinase
LTANAIMPGTDDQQGEPMRAHAMRRDASHARGPFRALVSFRALMVVAVAGLVLGAGAVAWGLADIKARADHAVAAWRAYEDQATDKERALRSFVANIGVGGMIDDFKTLVITGREDLAPRIHARAGAALGALESFADRGVTPAQADALAILGDMVRAYQERVAIADAMRRNGSSAERIDARVRIDDAVPDAALGALFGTLRGPRAEAADGPPSKPELLFDLRRALGYRRLAHAQKNYILRNEASDRARALAALADARTAVDLYKGHTISTEEAEALAVLERSFEGYETALAGGLIDELRARGLSPSDIDAAATPASAPILAALDTLDQVIAREEQDSRADLVVALGYVASASTVTARVVLGGAVVMVATSVWLLGFRVVLRVGRLTEAERALAAGDIHTEIPFTADRDEIGEMSRALLVFRDSMEDNAVLARELAESSRLASLGALVAGMAHELNTPIGNAVSVSSALGESLRCFEREAASGQLRRAALDDFVRRARDASAIIERNLLRASTQIGSFKQLAVDQIGDQRRRFTLDAALKDVVESMRPSVRRAGHSIALEAEPGVEIDGYPGALTQVVCNLVENSLRHGLADRRGGTISVAARRRDAAACEVSVSDDGVGVPEELQPKIFDAFFTTLAGKGGSGLGLHIVKTIVSGALGGGVSVESRPGAGSRFILHLPLFAPERGEPGEPSKERVYYAAA